MKNTAHILLLASLGLVSGLVQAAEGYAEDSSSSIIHTGFGDCLHTTRWSEQVAVVECEPAVVAAREAAKLAAVEVVMVKAFKPVRLDTQALFAFDSAELSDDGKLRLNDVLGSLTAADLQDEKIHITGHTDEIGSDSYNLKLSQKRASAVRDYLVSRGVVPGFIETSGVGEADPVVSCEGQRAKALINCLAPNRRTEVELSARKLVEVEKKASASQ